MSKDKQYCDHCADEIADNNFYVFTHSPVDFDSGWKGESAIFCVECYDTLIKPIMKNEVTIVWGTEREEETSYHFETQEELDAFLLGIAECDGWWEYEIKEKS